MIDEPSAAIASIHRSLNAIHELLGVDDPIHARLKIMNVDLKWWSAFDIDAQLVMVPVHFEDILSSQPGFVLRTSKLPWSTLTLTSRTNQARCVTCSAHRLRWSRSRTQASQYACVHSPHLVHGSGVQPPSTPNLAFIATIVSTAKASRASASTTRRKRSILPRPALQPPLASLLQRCHPNLSVQHCRPLPSIALLALGCPVALARPRQRSLSLLAPALHCCQPCPSDQPLNAVARANLSQNGITWNMHISLHISLHVTCSHAHVVQT